MFLRVVSIARHATNFAESQRCTITWIDFSSGHVCSVLHTFNEVCPMFQVGVVLARTFNRLIKVVYNVYVELQCVTSFWTIKLLGMQHITASSLVFFFFLPPSFIPHFFSLGCKIYSFFSKPVVFCLLLAHIIIMVLWNETPWVPRCFFKWNVYLFLFVQNIVLHEDSRHLLKSFDALQATSQSCWICLLRSSSYVQVFPARFRQSVFFKGLVRVRDSYFIQGCDDVMCCKQTCFVYCVAWVTQVPNSFYLRWKAVCALCNIFYVWVLLFE